MKLEEKQKKIYDSLSLDPDYNQTYYQAPQSGPHAPLEPKHLHVRVRGITSLEAAFWSFKFFLWLSLFNAILLFVISCFFPALMAVFLGFATARGVDAKSDRVKTVQELLDERYNAAESDEQSARR
jgi:uncharacterized membrane protein